ncbi:MAG: MBL fold metallo-hydrolase, partial [Candidatus Thorarchaeota archaeon]
MFPKRDARVFSKINEDIFLIHQDSMESMNFNTCNSYLVKLENTGYIIIDPGCSRKKLNYTIKENNIDIRDLKYVYLTHAHSDHVSLLDFLRRKNPDIKVLIHELDKKYIENSREYYNMLFNVSLLEKEEEYKDFTKTIKYYINPKSNYTVKSSFKMIFDIWNIKDRKIDGTFKNGDILNGNLEVIHSPGHTPGMCILLNKQATLLFSSDSHLSKV